MNLPAADDLFSVCEQIIVSATLESLKHATRLSAVTSDCSAADFRLKLTGFEIYDGHVSIMFFNIYRIGKWNSIYMSLECLKIERVKKICITVNQF